MKKLIYPDQNEELSKAVDGCFSRIILDSKMVKEASSNSLTREMLDECKPDKDHFLIHFIGVGDYERYGFNKNADAFTKEANEKYHKTFEKHAHLFREHNSSNPEVNAIGIIKKAMYNPEMGRTELAVWANIKKASEEFERAKAGETLSCSMGCFPKGTLVQVSKEKNKPIEELTRDDFVLSGSNRVKPLEDTYHYNFTGALITIKVTGTPQPIVCTNNHPIFIRRYKNKLLQDAPAICPVCGKHVAQLKSHITEIQDNEHQAFWKRYIDTLNKFEEKFIYADELNVGDYVASPIYSKKELEESTVQLDLHTQIRKAQFIEDDYVFKQITSINSEFVEDFEVFNLNVADEHTYIANGIVVHNCSVPFDVDSITGKHCKNASEYEPHMKKHAGQFIPEFNKYAFVYNTEPKFFDLSIVKRPAERIAHYLEYRFPDLDKQAFVKAASEFNACIPSAILAEIEGLHYHLDSSFSDPDKVDLLNKFASYEKEFKEALSNNDVKDFRTNFIKYAAKNSFSESESDFNMSELVELSNLDVRPESLFREFAKRAAVMPFKTFCNYIYGSNKLDQEAVKYASINLLPSLFSDLSSTDLDISELENLFNAGSVFDCTCDNVDADPVQKIMDKAEEKFSGDEYNRGNRIIKITVISPVEKIASINNSQSGLNTDVKTKNKAKEYAALYGIYKIAAVHDILNIGKNRINENNKEQFMISLIGQNYMYQC